MIILNNESTFFPDNWSKEKIKNEIAEAYGNIKRTEDIIDRKTGIKRWKKHEWVSKSWQKYEIIEDLNWNIETVYGKF